LSQKGGKGFFACVLLDPSSFSPVMKSLFDVREQVYCNPTWSFCLWSVCCSLVKIHTTLVNSVKLHIHYQIREGFQIRYLAVTRRNYLVVLDHRVRQSLQITRECVGCIYSVTIHTLCSNAYRSNGMGWACIRLVWLLILFNPPFYQ